LVESSGTSTWSSTSRCINITVHGIGPTVRELEPDEDQTWVSVEQFEQLLDAVAERTDVRIMFDDGNASDMEVALPRLLDRGLRAEFFVLAGLLDEPGRLRADDVRELVSSGMSIGSHGWAHRDWRRVNESQANEEIVAAPRVLRELTGQPASAVAIPFGSYDRHVLRRLREARVARVYTSDGGPARSTSWLQPRNSVRHDLDPAWLARTLEGHTAISARVRKFAARRAKHLRGHP
jgi:peptidoglycan/xylan/chitin deacetylase (PgdA/CDA1 family)